jgi:hypothetical protein
MKPYTFSCYPPFGGWPEKGQVGKAKEDLNEKEKNKMQIGCSHPPTGGVITDFKLAVTNPVCQQAGATLITKMEKCL